MLAVSGIAGSLIRSRAGVDRAAARGTASARAGTLLIAVGVLTICLAAPAALVSAQSPAPAGPTADAGQGRRAGSRPAAEQPPQPPPAADPPGPSATPPTPPGTPDDPTPPPDDARRRSPDPSTLVSAAGSTSVSILDGNSQSAFRFSPSSITVGAGDTVSWTNNGSASEGARRHAAAASASGTLHSGQSYSHTFASPGTFSYICSIHPFMKGTVTVQATSSGGGAGGGGGDPGRDAVHRGVPHLAGLGVRGGDLGGRGRKRHPAPLDRHAAVAAARRRLRAAARGGLLRRRTRVSSGNRLRRLDRDVGSAPSATPLALAPAGAGLGAL